MQIIVTLALVAQILSAIGVIVLVLLQHGKGADMGAAFGSGSGGSGSLFGATGSANFLSRLTAGLATVFFICTLGLAFAGTEASGGDRGGSVMQRLGDIPVPGAIQPSGPAGSVPTAPSPAPGEAQKSAPSNEIPK